MVDIKPFVPPSEVIFHLDDLPNHQNQSEVKLSVSALMFGVLKEPKSYDLTLATVNNYLKKLKQRYRLKDIRLYWDINDHKNCTIEQGPVFNVLEQIYEIAIK